MGSPGEVSGLLHARPTRKMGSMRVPIAPLLVALAAAPALAGDRMSLELDHWETARAPAGGAPAKLAKSSPRLAFAAAEPEVVARCVFELPSEMASRPLTV